jgi:adenylyltransferase/sulfurtransferase
VDLTNLQRQILHRTDAVGMSKVASGKRTLGEINPECQIIALAERLSAERLEQEVAQADIVLDCCDNFATRHAVNRACVKFRKPLVSGAAIRFDGQVVVFDSRQANAPCYHCLFPEGQEVEEVRCAVMGVFAPLTGIIGTVQAAEALKLLIGCGTSLAGRLLLLDGLGMEWREIRVPRDPACQVCGGTSVA